MVTFHDSAPRIDFRPQAIIWRPAWYFSPIVCDGADELDRFRYVSFSIGNQVDFELRTYDGHPQETATVYLSFPDDRRAEILESITLILKELHLPSTCLAWIRGQTFEYGVLPRPPEDRLREKEARSLVLKILSKEPQWQANTTRIKSRVPAEFNLSPIDLEQSPSRKNEKEWQQIIGNVISHRTSSEGIISRKLAIKDGATLTMTNAGAAYLNSIGYSAG